MILDFQLGQAFDHQTVDMFVSDNLLDNCSIELDAGLSLEQEQRQFSSCLEADVEKRAHTNCDYLDAQTSNHEDYMGSGAFNFAVGPVEQFSAEITFAFNNVEHTDDLHAALKQFQLLNICKESLKGIVYNGGGFWFHFSLKDEITASAGRT